MTGVRIVSIGCLLAGSLLAACGVGGVDPGGTGMGTHPGRIPSDDPKFDARLDALGINCESSIMVTGTFAPGDPAPTGHTGCWAVGTWTVEATLDHIGCDPQPDLVAEWVYDVTRDVDSNTNVVFVNDPKDTRVNLKITTDGSDACLGAFQHFALDNTVVNLRPILAADNTLSGAGVFDMYDHNPF